MDTPSRHPPGSRWSAARQVLARRVIAAGFWFFLAKGLLWLAAPAAIWLASS